VFCLGLLEDGEIRVGILPEREEFQIGYFGFGGVARGSVCPAPLQVRQGAYRIRENDAAMIEDLLEFGRCLLAASGGEVSLAAYISRIKASEFGKERSTRYRKVVWNRPLQSLDRVQRRPFSESGKSVQGGKILELHRRIFREPFRQVGGESLGFRKVSR